MAPEIITIDRRLERLLALVPFSSARKFFGLEYSMPVRNVRPCPQCGEGVVLISLGGEISIVDAIPDPESEPFRRRWSANVLSEHECAGCRQ